MDEQIEHQNKTLISTDLAAQLTGYTRNYVGELARDGHVDSTKVGRRRFIDREDVLAYADKNKASSNAGSDVPAEAERAIGEDEGKSANWLLATGKAAAALLALFLVLGISAPDSPSSSNLSAVGSVNESHKADQYFLDTLSDIRRSTNPAAAAASSFHGSVIAPVKDFFADAFRFGIAGLVQIGDLFFEDESLYVPPSLVYENAPSSQESASTSPPVDTGTSQQSTVTYIHSSPGSAGFLLTEAVSRLTQSVAVLSGRVSAQDSDRGYVRDYVDDQLSAFEDTVQRNDESVLDAADYDHPDDITLDGIEVTGQTDLGRTNITGTTSIDGSTLYVDVANKRVGIGTSTPQYTLDVDGTFRAGSFVAGSGTSTFTHLAASSADITTLSASSSNLDAADVDDLVVTNSTTTNATTTNSYIQNLLADNGTVTDFTGTRATITNSTTTDAYVANLTASISDLNIATITDLVAVNSSTTNAAISNATTTNFFASLANFTTAFFDTLTTTVANITDLNVENATSTNLVTTNLSATGTTNFATATVDNITISGTATTSNLTVLNDVIFGDTTTDSLTVNSTVGSDLVPNSNAVFDLGSPSFFWDTAYVDTLNANNISAASTSISGTAAEEFAINTDNSTQDGENSSLIFYRGQVTPNAVIGWDSAEDRFDFNQPALFWNEASSTTIPTVVARAVNGQTADLFQAASSSGSVLTSISATGTVSAPVVVATSVQAETITADATSTLTTALVDNLAATTAVVTNLAGTNSTTTNLTATGNIDLATSTIQAVTVGGDTIDNFTGTGLSVSANVLGVDQSALNVEDFSTSLAPGSVVFSDGSSLAEDSANLYWDDTSDRLGIGTSTPAVSLAIDATDAFLVPAGTTAERPTGTTGYLRYNTTDQKFEGYSAGSWQEIGGGLTDTDQDTYITAEESADDDHLRFYTAGSEQLTIDNAGQVGIGTNAPSAALDVLGNTVLQGRLDIFGETIAMGNGNFIELANLDSDTTTFIRYNSAGSAEIAAELQIGNNQPTDLIVTGDSSAASFSVGGDIISDFTGTGLSVAGNVLSVDLGTSISLGELDFDPITEAELDTEAELETQLTDASNVFTNNDGALSDDDLSDNNTDDLSEGATNLYSQWSETGSDIYYSGGNVGIGVSGPTEALDVNGITRLRSEVYARRGITGGYGDTSGSGSDWGANIWSIGDDWSGNDAGSGFSADAGQYGLTWLRDTHVDADGFAGEGLHLWRAGTNFASFGHTGSRFNTAVDINGALDASTLNTGQGDNELYAMNQDVQTTDNVTFNSSQMDYAVFNNNEKSSFSPADQRIWMDASAGLYIHASNLGAAGVGRLAWTGDNFTAGNQLNVSYDSEDQPTLNVSNSPTFSGLTSNGDIDVDSDQVFINRASGGEARFHVYNQGGQAEWLLGQKSQANSDFIISSKDTFGEDDILIIDASSGQVGIGATDPSYLLEVNGSAAKPGGGSWSNSSDRRIKEDIATIDNALGKVRSLNPVTFNWRNPEIHGGNSTAGGFIAQEVAQIFPDWVSMADAKGGDAELVGPDGKMYVLNLPFEFDAYIVGSIKELDKQVQELAQNRFWVEEMNGERPSDNLLAAVRVVLEDFTDDVSARFGEVFADRIVASDSLEAGDRICIDGECITKSQLSTLIELSKESGAPNDESSTSGGGPDSLAPREEGGGSSADDATTTPSDPDTTSSDESGYEAGTATTSTSSPELEGEETGTTTATSTQQESNSSTGETATITATTTDEVATDSDAEDEDGPAATSSESVTSSGDDPDVGEEEAPTDEAAEGDTATTTSEQ